MNYEPLPFDPTIESLTRPVCPWCGYFLDTGEPADDAGYLECGTCGKTAEIITTLQYTVRAVTRDEYDHRNCDIDWDSPNIPNLIDEHKRAQATTFRINRTAHTERLTTLLETLGYERHGNWLHPGREPQTIPGLYIRPYLWDYEPASANTEPPANLEWHGLHPIRIWWYKYALRSAYADRPVTDTYITAALDEIETALNEIAQYE